jgi:pimeloyl-ACP methyl ester carboxylesterase
VDIVLIPGFWLDASSWDEVVPVLERAGHRPHAVTLPGMERDADRSAVTLRDQVDAVAALIDTLGSGPVVLVGHSGGGAVAHAAVDARPDKIARVVYAASEPLGHGDIINDGFPSENGEIPLPDWSEFGDEELIDLDDRLRAAFRARAIPTPVGVATGPQQLSDERRYDVPVTVIACEYSSEKLKEWMAQGHLDELARIRQVHVVDLPTGHWPQFTRPRELGRAILDAVGPA